MTTSSSNDKTVLALFPPIVNGQTSPVVGAHIGVPLVAYDLVTDGEGAVVLVDPPPVGTMDPGDVMELWLKDESAALDSETIDDPNLRTTLRIPKGRLHPDRVNELYYTIRRGSQNIGLLDPPLTLLYNKIRPGLKDKYDAPGGHSELKLLLPDSIKNGVGADFVSADVCVAYPYCRAYDLITLKCNGELMTANVSPNQAPQPPNPGSEEPITICFTLTRDYLDKAKRLDQKLHFSYTVTDQIGNGPDTDAPWSPVQVVDEDLDGKRLPKPILLERLEDFPGDDAEEIDLKKLAGNPLLLVVLTADNRFLAGDDVLATYTAKDTGQPVDVVVNVSGKVTADPFGVKKTLFLEVLNAKVFAGSRVTVTYELRRPNGDLVGNSVTANATVTGATPIDLLPPTLVAPAVDPVDVLDYPNGVTMRIEYHAALDGDRARLVEVNPPEGSPQLPLVAFNSNKRVNTVLTLAYLVARQGKTLELRWNLNRNGGQAGKSTPTPVRVLKIADGDSRLPTPNIAGNTSTVLDVEALTDGARILAVKWPVFEPAQPIWVTCKGFDNNGNPISTEVRSGEPNDSLDGLNVQAPVAWLKALKDGSALTVECAVSLDGSRDRTRAVLLPLRTYTIKAVEDVKPEITQVLGSPSGVEIPDNGFTVETDLTLSGSAAKGLDIEVYDGQKPKGVATADPVKGIWTLPISDLSEGAHTYKAKALYNPDLTSAERTVLKTRKAVENFDKYPDMPISPGQKIETDYMTFLKTDALGGARIYALLGVTPPIPGKIEKKVFLPNIITSGNARITIELRQKCYRVAFWYAYFMTGAHFIKYHNQEGQLVSKQLNNGASEHRMDITGQISKIYIECGVSNGDTHPYRNSGCMDNFELYFNID